jgi:hypothetical protein
MQHRWLRLHARVFNLRSVFPEEVLALFLALFIFIMPAAADTRFEIRGLYMNSSEPAATTDYTVSMGYKTPEAVGSVDMLFCIDPIPYMPCVTPPGLDVSHASLAAQTGETGFSILSQSSNHIILSRLPSMIMGGTVSTYKFNNIKNPVQDNQAFSIRLKSLGSIDGSGAQIDFGSVRGEVQSGIVIETQVPPMLIFCAAEQVEDDCTSTNETYYSNMGTLSSDTTLVARSQMAVGTNATGGFAITVSGAPLSAGNHVIDSPTSPTASVPGTDQFGINLVANTDPAIGIDPQGTWANAVASPDYNIPNQYKYVSGDVVAYSPNVSLMKKFTVSYILNASPNLHIGVYSTTLTYIASGRF